jgi:hypothetical protein
MKRNALGIMGRILWLFGLLSLLVGVAACQPGQIPPGVETNAITERASPTTTMAVPTLTATCSQTPLPSSTRKIEPTRTPAATEENRCQNYDPKFFQPSEIPDLLLQSDAELLRQSSLYTEIDISRFQSYGGASYGTEIRWHKVCHEKLPHPTLYSYCRIERVTSRVHVMTGEVQGIPETFINDSFIRGLEIWVRPEGGEWQLVGKLDPATRDRWIDAYMNSPFFFRMRGDCRIDMDYRGSESVCFEINVPEFFRTVFDEEITLVECLSDKLGILWIDPQTQLPKQLRLSFYSAVFFPDQAKEEWSYNVWVDVSIIYHSFNEDFDFPQPEESSS